MPQRTIEDKRATWRRYYARNKKEIRQQIERRKEANRNQYEKYKKTLKCSRCPENHPACLEFHHKDSTKKEIEVTKAVFSNRWSIKRILEEIEKCEVLCCNCHRKLHYNEKTGERG